MKKSLLITLDWPPNQGGVSRYYSNLVSLWPSDRIQVLTQPATDSAGFDGQQEYKIIRQKLLSDRVLVWPKWLGLIFRLKKIIQQEQIEILQVGQVLPIGSAVYFLNIFFKIPYIVYTHGLDISQPLRQSRRRWLMKKVLTKAVKIIANSDFTRKILIDSGIAASKIEVVTPGCDLIGKEPQTNRCDELRSQYNLNNKKVLLTLGRLKERKGIDRVISALAQLKDKYPDLVYLIVGDGNYRKTLEALVAEHRLNSRIIFTGAISDSDRVNYHELADIFIMPARQLPDGDVEGFGIVFLEANYFGKPVIGGSSGGVSEAIINNQTGLIVDSTRVEAVAQAIDQLLAQPEQARQLGLAGQKRVMTDFQWASRAQKIQNIITNL